jgi:hypothetical protein
VGIETMATSLRIEEGSASNEGEKVEMEGAGD